MEYLASFAVDCKFAPEFESCYIFAQIERGDSLHEYRTYFQVCILMEHTYALSNEALGH